MPGRQRLAFDGAGALRPPQRERVEQPLHDAARAPQHEQVAGDALTGGARLAVVGQVDAGADQRAWPRPRISATRSAAIARLLCGAWSAPAGGRLESP